MKYTKEGGVKPSVNVEYEEKPISVKLTKKTRDMLDYIQENTQINKSDAIRLSISRFYNELKQEIN